MNTHQKFVKYLATTLAVLLIIAIIGGIVGGVLFLTGVFPSGGKNQKQSSEIVLKNDNDDDDDDDSSTLGDFIGGIIDSAASGGDMTAPDENGGRKTLTADDFSSRSYTFRDIEDIEIDTSIYSIYFSKDSVSEIQVELTNVYNGYIVKQDGSTLKLKEPDNLKNFSLDKLFDLLDGVNVKKEASVRITVPEDFSAREVEIDGGVGNISLEDLTAEHLEIDAGVGDIKGFRVTASSADIDGGTGNITFTSSAFGDTEIDSGVGNVSFSGTLRGHVSIDCGVGNTELSLSDSKDSYYLSLEKGLGTMTLNGNKIKSDDDYTENPGAPYSLDISGGVGSITIDFAD